MEDRRRPPGCLPTPGDWPSPRDVSVPGDGSCQRPGEENGGRRGWLEAIDYQPGRLCPLGRDEETVSIHFYLVVRTKNYFLMFEVVTTSINVRTE